MIAVQNLAQGGALRQGFKKIKHHGHSIAIMAFMQGVDPHTPILIGAGQCVQRAGSQTVKSPIQMMADAAALAAVNTGLGDRLWPQIDTLLVTRFIVDAPTARPLPFDKYQNPPRTLAKQLDITPPHLVYGPTGGNSPQLLVNLMAERIAQGQHKLVLLAGSECMHSLVRALKDGTRPAWHDQEAKDDKDDMEDLGQGESFGSSKSEIAHGLHMPINVYPMFENAIREHRGQNFEEHQNQIGELMAPFSQVAARHPQAWFPKTHQPQDIAKASPDNRYVGFPYTKYMNAIMQVDQSAALVMTNVETAEQLGIPPEKWVFLHGCADVNDIWLVSERINFHSSPAIRLMGKTALDMAGWRIDDVDLIDIYSCFPSAVQISRNALGIAEDDPRALTVTGGLPYFGGCGNNYTMHAIATMMEQLRARPGSKGLCTANGWYLTKHAIGLYSTLPRKKAHKEKWQRTPPAKLQAEIDANDHPQAIDSAQGAAHIEAYTVVHKREGPQHGLIIGRLKDTGQRFTALVKNSASCAQMMTQNHFQQDGQVAVDDKGLNIWTPAA